jgi:hypothetical protein
MSHAIGYATMHLCGLCYVALMLNLNLIFGLIFKVEFLLLVHHKWYSILMFFLVLVHLFIYGLKI